jgi:hypothetical protein
MLDSIWRPEVLPFLTGAVIAVVAIVATLFTKTIREGSRNELKRAMVERGMTADEIERVLAADAAG